MRSIRYSQRRALVCASLCLTCLPPYSAGQNNGVLTLSPIVRVHVKRGQELTEHLAAALQPGFHVNSDQPADSYLIPLKLTWLKGPLETQAIIYPKPQLKNYAFSQRPVSVFSDKFEIVTRFRAAASAQPGMALMNGKLRYQACNEKECLAPKTMDVQFAVDIQ